MKPIYLDHAATTPMDPTVVAAMNPFYTELFYNPSAQYDAARSVKRAIQEARAQIAHYIGARPSELIFTAGGTEANNLAIHGVMQRYPDSKLIVTAIEHDSVLMPATRYNSGTALVQPDGRLNIEGLRSQIDDDTVLISVQYVNNEIGTIQPLKEVTALIADVKKDRINRKVSLPLYLHTDACQAGNYLDLHTNRLGVDLMTINASKIYGPKQIGVLYISSALLIDPQILGGGQERGMRSGTENVPAIIGFARALQLVQDRRQAEAERVAALRTQFCDAIMSNIPHAIINGTMKHRIANNIHVTFPGYDNERLMMQLDMRNIICAVGSACSASSEEPSHVLKAIGLSDAAAQSSLRFTLGVTTTSEEVGSPGTELEFAL